MSDSKKEFFMRLAEIQSDLKAPKNQVNKFGGYNYRSCEDILEGLKKVKGDLMVFVSDSIEVHCDRVYVKATVTITDGVNEVSNHAFAREPFDKKGMDESQITGAASSYARKYALNGLLCIDDTKDADSMDKPQLSDKALAALEVFKKQLASSVTPLAFYCYQKRKGHEQTQFLLANLSAPEKRAAEKKAGIGEAAFTEIVGKLKQNPDAANDALSGCSESEVKMINKALEEAA